MKRLIAIAGIALIVEIYTPLGWRVSVTEGANVTHIEFTERQH
jgi:hypothetical protein